MSMEEQMDILVAAAERSVALRNILRGLRDDYVRHWGS